MTSIEETRVESAESADAKADAQRTGAPKAPEANAGKRLPRGHAREIVPATAEAGSTVPATEPASATARSEGAQPTEPRPTKLSILIDLLARVDGASIAEMMAATGWQAHSVRGAMAGALCKRGHAVVSSKAEDGVRRYRIGAEA